MLLICGRLILEWVDGVADEPRMDFDGVGFGDLQCHQSEFTFFVSEILTWYDVMDNAFNDGIYQTAIG